MADLPKPIGGRPPRIPATDPRYHQALDTFADLWGMRVERVLLPTHFVVFEVDGEPQVCMNADGVRALALLAPNPDAPKLAEDIIRAARRRPGGES